MIERKQPIVSGVFSVDTNEIVESTTATSQKVAMQKKARELSETTGTAHVQFEFDVLGGNLHFISKQFKGNKLPAAILALQKQYSLTEHENQLAEYNDELQLLNETLAECETVFANNKAKLEAVCWSLNEQINKVEKKISSKQRTIRGFQSDIAKLEA